MKFFKTFLFSVCAALAVVIFIAIYNNANVDQPITDNAENKKFDSEEKSKSPDQPDKAYELEFLKTRDPKTNTVPTERLIPS
ncbi:MAG: hypothetical protein M3P82_02865, partial [Bacteroidota bacterium]|nr:hypothetical protein [Bacteroidota bacterium]